MNTYPMNPFGKRVEWRIQIEITYDATLNLTLIVAMAYNRWTHQLRQATHSLTRPRLV